MDSTLLLLTTACGYLTPQVCFAVAVVAGAGGIGGGVLFVPILQILGEFSAKDAVPISNVESLFLHFGVPLPGVASLVVPF